MRLYDYTYYWNTSVERSFFPQGLAVVLSIGCDVSAREEGRRPLTNGRPCEPQNVEEEVGEVEAMARERGRTVRRSSSRWLWFDLNICFFKWILDIGPVGQLLLLLLGWSNIRHWSGESDGADV